MIDELPHISRFRWPTVAAVGVVILVISCADDVV